MRKKLLQRIFQGFFIGIAVGQLICVLISLMNGEDFIICSPEFIELTGSEAAAAAVQTLLCGVIGSGFSGASVIWETDTLSIAAQSGLCFAIYAVILLPAAYITGWAEHSLAGLLSYAGIFAASFAVVWIIQYIVWKKRLAAINKKLND